MRRTCNNDDRISLTTGQVQRDRIAAAVGCHGHCAVGCDRRNVYRVVGDAIVRTCGRLVPKSRRCRHAPRRDRCRDGSRPAHARDRNAVTGAGSRYRHAGGAGGAGKLNVCRRKAHNGFVKNDVEHDWRTGRRVSLACSLVDRDGRFRLHRVVGAGAGSRAATAAARIGCAYRIGAGCEAGGAKRC
ncbi:hypothetical protein D3C87_1419600 [compost metagenome]